MTAPTFISNFNSNAANDDLPLPDMAPVSALPSALPQPLPGITDTGRITFGAACRLPTPK
jgi:hypothetical protein